MRWRVADAGSRQSLARPRVQPVLEAAQDSRDADCRGVDVSMDGIELQDREFVAAIREGREPNSSIAQVMPCYRTLAALEEQLA